MLLFPSKWQILDVSDKNFIGGDGWGLVEITAVLASTSMLSTARQSVWRYWVTSVIFSIFSRITKCLLPIYYHVRISQVAPQRSCGATCRIWMWLKGCKRITWKRTLNRHNNECCFSSTPNHSCVICYSLKRLRWFAFASLGYTIMFL